MAEDNFLPFAGITLLVIFFLGSKFSGGTQSAFAGFGSFFSTTPGLILAGVFGVMLIVGFFIPKGK